ncbi:MAG: regulatory protein RecX [Deltaproteobacteria bacterium]|nr:regulatory protein RecX [Deltaproteobacteria bacterium]
MNNEEELKRAKRTALQMLTFRTRSKQEIRDKLTQKGISASIVETVLAHLTDYGYLDDQAFGQQLALSLFETKGWGFARIGVTLRARGLSPELVKKTISQLKENYSEEKTALRIMKRRFSHFDFHEAPPKEKQRITQFFRRRGFSWETISRVLMI